MSAEIQLQQEQQLTQRQALELSDLQRELRSQKLSVESLQRELSAIRARSSPTHPARARPPRLTLMKLGAREAAQARQMARALPAPLPTRTAARRLQIHSHLHMLPLRGMTSTRCEKHSPIRLQSSERQGEAERGSPSCASRPRVNLTLDGHTASIRHLEDELAAMSNAQRAVSGLDEATTAAQVAQVTETRPRECGRSWFARKETAVAMAALLRGDEATSGAAGAAGRTSR